jgi:hypothetical protein
MEPMLEAAVAFAAVNSAMLLALLFIYGKIVMRSRASDPIGLVFFAFLLLLQNLLTVFSYMAMWPLFTGEIVPYLLAFSVLEFGGLIVLLRVTL